LEGSGAAALSGWRERRFQLLAVDVRIRTNCTLLDRQLDYLVLDAVQDYPVTTSIHFDATREAGQYRICADGAEPWIEGDPATAMNRLYQASYRKLYQSLPPSSAFLHSACGTMHGCRFLLMGESGAGKTTLITRLAREGALVEGDELVVLHEDRAVAVPRRFRIKDHGLSQLPWLAAAAERMPVFENLDGSRVYAFAPSEAGYPWHIRDASIDAVIFLEPNHGGQSRVVEIAKPQMVQLAMAEARVVDGQDRSWIPMLCRQFDRASCYRLVIGDLDKAVALLISKCRGLLGSRS
jgi:hypothetical protein